MWSDAAGKACREIVFVSHESLSRRGIEVPGCDFVIIDEAHHARNPATKRYAAISRLVANVPLLLLTATPVHNHARDTDHLLALFLGEDAARLGDAAFARCVIRRERVRPLVEPDGPVIATPRWIHVSDRVEVAHGILALPPPVPPSDGGDGGALVAHGLIRLWASSDAALEAGLLRRLRRAHAMSAALEAGTFPSQSDLTAWSGAGDTIQLAFAELVAPRCENAGNLFDAVRAHAHGIDELLRLTRASRERDDSLSAAVLDIRSRHPGVRIVAFSQYADTVLALFRSLVSAGKVAALTAKGWLVAGGRMSRREILDRFSRARSQPGAEDIDILIATDLLSEGLNLQSAGVVVHLDLPWTPARVEQRLGRIARIGSSHSVVYSYAVHPPATAESLVQIEKIIERKLESVATIATTFAPLGSLPVSGESRTSISQRIGEVLSTWLERGRPGVSSVAAVAGDERGFLAACRIGGKSALVTFADDRVSDSPGDLLQAVRCASGGDVPLDDVTRAQAELELERYFRGLDALRASTPADTGLSSVRRCALRRATRALRGARPHERSRMAGLVDSAGKVLRARLSHHSVQLIEQSMHSIASDEDWLHRVISLGSAIDSAGDAGGFELTGLILFEPARR
jgi:hypothetical protein